MAIHDLGVPNVAGMQRILDFLDAEDAAGGMVYLHCWGGVGRTDTVVGCHLVRRGYSGEEALALIAELWTSMAKRNRHPLSPETEQQRKFVRDWEAVEARRVGASRAAPDGTRRRREFFRGCLLGGAVGDALGAPVEFLTLAKIRRRYGAAGIGTFDEAYGRVGAITDDTQMTLFTAEGLLRTICRARHKGLASAAGVVYLAYLRWLHTQGYPWDGARGELDGWLVGVRELHSQRAPGDTCLSALLAGRPGSIEEPANDNKGCGGVMRAAPAGLVRHDDPFALGREIAALTHGHPSGYLAAGCLSAIVAGIVAGQGLEEALSAAMAVLARQPRHEECTRALERALAAHRAGPASAETVESLGAGWVAEEALAIGVYCALTAGEDFAAGVRLSVNHGGDSDSTGSIAGNLLGALLGVQSIPAEWLAGLELRREITELADDLLTEFRPDDEWWQRYPGW
jgi:ADP-ribosyl-[dinitrogen reductase] hydrolase